MDNDIKIGVAIPCFMGGEKAIQVVKDCIEFADSIVFVDDACPLKTGKALRSQINSSKLHIIYNKSNMGVGGSTKKGFYWLLGQGCKIILKIDADGQMDPKDIPKFVRPLINNECEATKGNRFTDLEQLLQMPKIRLIGNALLSYITKLTTGYWDLFDPTNGFIAFKSEVLKNIDLYKTDNRFFFETDLLFRCSLKNIFIKNVSIDVNYSNNFSSLNPLYQFPIFLIKHIKVLFKRIFYQYYILDFNQGSIDLILFFFTGLLALIIGLSSVYKSNITGVLTSAGSASLFTILSVICIQLLLSFIYYDCTTRLLFKIKR